MTGNSQEHENRVLGMLFVADITSINLTKNGIGGYKATLSNPNTSETAKDHAREVLDAAGVPDYTGSTEAEFSEHDTRVLAGYKAALNSECRLLGVLRLLLTMKPQTLVYRPKPNFMLPSTSRSEVQCKKNLTEE
jgi:hypothetical protein